VPFFLCEHPHCAASKQCAFECVWQRPISLTKLASATKFAGLHHLHWRRCLFVHASHATSRLWSTSCTVFFAKQLSQIVHHAAAPDIRGTCFIWLSTLQINLPSIDHQCHVMPSGLKKYGWEAHDGKSYGRQELFDEHFHLTTSWVSVCVAHLITTTRCQLQHNDCRILPGCHAGAACLGPVLSLHEKRRAEGANARVQVSGCKCQAMTARAFFTMLQHSSMEKVSKPAVNGVMQFC